MDIKHNHEKILIIVALVLCAGILFYNAFFIPDISIPSVIYVNSSASDTQESSANENSNSETTESSESTNNSESNSDANSKSSSSSNTVGGKVNINTATAEELDEKLTGIGPTIAKRIIEYRNSIGKFSSIEEIKNVSGIGDKTFEKFKDMICV